MASGSITASVSNLAGGTTYYYRAFVAEYNQSTGLYDYRYGSVRSFTTSAPQGYPAAGWLELPASTGAADYVGTLYGSGGETEENRNYTFNYSYTYYASMWVAYPLTGAHKTGSANTNSWNYYPNIPNSRQVSITGNSYGTMYGNSAYSRGHQCPDASRKSDDTMNSQTYYATNQTPQLQDKFNASIWSSLENAVRGLVSSASDIVYVVTGPAYRKAGGSETINYLTGAAGKNANPAQLPIANYYWKAILKVKKNGAGLITSAQTVGFWFEHREYEKGDSYANYCVSVNQIEQWTGFDLFTNLPDELEEASETNASWATFQSF
ncbi:MAG: DNA/RNA non-specific endonuclease [Bacteroidales bacterium]|nr:DNA/RNA non-specific endonuclease [Bacteroidales bacterium]